MKQDHVLVHQHRKGDKKATSELVERYQQTVYAIVFRICKDHAVTEDLVQDSFIRAFERIHQFEERSTFKSWLCRIAINLTKNYLTSYRSRNVQILDDPERETHPAPNQEIRHGQMELQALLRGLIEELPPKQRMSVMLRIFDDMSFSEIAEAMDCPFDTAKANYRHGILALKKRIFRKQGGLAHELQESLRQLD